jgi:adenylate cyclase
VYTNRELVFCGHFAGAVEVGRQVEGEGGPFARFAVADRSRLVIARRDEHHVSRRHALLEPVGEQRPRLTNLSGTGPLRLYDGQELSPGASTEIGLPTLFSLGATSVRVQELGEAADFRLASLDEATRPPGAEAGPTSRFPGLGEAGQPPDAKRLLRWLRATLAVFHGAAGSANFFERAAQAILDVAGLDSGRIFLLRHGDWQVQAVCNATPEPEGPASRTVLESVRQEKRTFRQFPAVPGADSPSLQGVQAVVAAPILSRAGAVLGALYGDRRSAADAAEPITELEAMLVELLAGGVAAGLARLEQEQAALKARVRFEQFFTPELAHHLAAHPDLLGGRDAEITVLFCDVRGFSRHCESLDPATTVAWVGDVLDALSDCVRAHEGVLVDYIGDELVAMWGAPEDQPSQAAMACRAALDMLQRLPVLNERWQSKVCGPTTLGIGINSGPARVGNTGSRHKFKYGPLGHSVNLASRVQGVTKHLGCPLLITGATRARLDGSFASRRLGLVGVLNIAEPVELYELAEPNLPGWPEAAAEYEAALALFEKGNFKAAVALLAARQAQQPEDGPARLLLYRAARALVEGPAPSHPVWTLTDK